MQDRIKVQPEAAPVTQRLGLRNPISSFMIKSIEGKGRVRGDSIVIGTDVMTAWQVDAYVDKSHHHIVRCFR